MAVMPGVMDSPVILRKVADRDFVAPDHLAGVDGELLGRRPSTKPVAVAEQGSQQSGLPGSVAAHQGNFLAARDARAENGIDFKSP